MERTLLNNTGDTIRIRRPARVTTDPLGRNVWMGNVEPCALDVINDVETDPYNSTCPDIPPIFD